MSKLPKINHPTFTMKLPSNDKEVKYRTLRGKEEKLLLVAKESDDIDTIMSTLKEVIQNCIIDYDVDKMALFDIEYALLQIRSKSINNVVEFSITDDETEEQVDLKLDMEAVKVHVDEEHTKNIKADEDTVLVMRYPSFDEFKTILKASDDRRAQFDVMLSCIESVISGDSIVKMSDVSKEDIEEFVDDLSDTTINQIEKFFDTMPVLRHEMKYTNKNGNERTFVIEGLETFFV